MSARSAGAAADAFRFALVEDGKGTFRIIELTYAPTGVTRWYDMRKPEWSEAAVSDFGQGMFDR